MALIYMVRHAENRANVERVMSHRVVDYPLTALGEQQARALGAWFKGHPLACIYTSPLRRARQTAAQIATATGARVVEVEALRELDVGPLDGKGSDADWAEHDAMIARWLAGEWDARFAGGESYREAYDRLTRFVAEIAQRHPRENVTAVGHGGLYSTVLPRFCAVPGHDGVSPMVLKNTGVTLIRHQEGAFVCDLWGSIEHLPGA